MTQGTQKNLLVHFSKPRIAQTIGFSPFQLVLSNLKSGSNDGKEIKPEILYLVSVL
ncbi:hypothetical protein [Rivularia sp. UHCC 0363]|uniref:hypothetical protein n=1 Tax=Rivularia sp. UHCC 0363 TaxID=3110244 RepID=UPI002B21A902|nr:hypothetical protein [Rivularia sp. UHCC 0363]MEA5597139.1 hypothetical protein [Rivularia sp. UHCC 0363]